ncbi:hypothetical protein MTO96_003628 [Rhipicephalus appendiculatus]
MLLKNKRDYILGLRGGSLKVPGPLTAGDVGTFSSRILSASCLAHLKWTQPGPLKIQVHVWLDDRVLGGRFLRRTSAHLLSVVHVFAAAPNPSLQWHLQGNPLGSRTSLEKTSAPRGDCRCDILSTEAM